MLGPGYWVSPDKRILQIDEHQQYIVQHYEEFGFSEEEIQKAKSSPDPRTTLLLKVMNRGWLRVRKTTGRQGESWSFEFIQGSWPLVDWLFDVVEVAQKIGVHPYDTMVVNVMSREGSLLKNFTLDFSQLTRSLAPGGGELLEELTGRLASEATQSRNRFARAVRFQETFSNYVKSLGLKHF